MIKLAKSPGIDHWREGLAGKRHRFFTVCSYLIVYRHEAKTLQIVRVLRACAKYLGIVAGRTVERTK